MKIRHILLALPAFGALWLVSTPAPFRPIPTEVLGGAETEEANNRARKAWFEHMHRAPPGVGWREIERENGLAATARRAKGRAPAAPGTWVEHGSDNQAGRMHGGLWTDDRSTFYAISSLGGVWKGTPEGEGWVPIGDNLYGGAQSIVLLPATGSGDAVVLVATDSGMVHRSDDDGQAWEVPAGLEGFSSVKRALRMSDGSDTVLVAGGPNDDYGIWRSTDGGSSFEEVYRLGPYSGDVWVPRDGGGSIFAATGEGVVRSDDHGETWSVVGNIPGAGAWVQLVGSEAGAPTLYAVTWGGGYQLSRSDDGGASWTELGGLGDYYGEIEASILDPELVAWGGVELWRSEDKGDSSSKINRWDEYYGDPENLLHADVMGMNVQLDGAGGEVWWIGCDGGIYRSDDGLGSVRNLSMEGLRVSQYYSTLTSSADPSHVAAGAQDQGYQVTQGGDTSGDLWDFVQALSGDYGHLSSSDGSHALVIAVYPGLLLYAEGEESVSLSYDYFPDADVYAWIPPVAADPSDPDVAWFGADELWRGEKGSRRWTWERTEHDFGLQSWEYVSAMAFAPSNPDKVYVATNAGRSFHSEDHAASWTRGADFEADAQYFYGNAIAVDPLDADHAFLGGSGYGEPAVYETWDGGVSWTAWSDGLPQTLIYSLAILRDGSGRVFAGGEQGAYMRGPDDAEWTDITAGAPMTIYWSAEVVPGENTVRFGTYGRGIWDFELAPEDGDADGFAAGDDCDDDEAAVFPGAEEACGDGIDQDCSGRDLGCPTSVSVGTVIERVEVEEKPAEGEEGCGCRGAPSPAWLGLLAAMGLRRRR